MTEDVRLRSSATSDGRVKQYVARRRRSLPHMTSLIRCAMALTFLYGLHPLQSDAATAVDYAQASAWLCRAAAADVCSQALTSTVVSPTDGSLIRKTYRPDPTALVDCFYVYPTVSRQLQGNADMTAAPEEKRVAVEQLALFSTTCRTYAPLYRQTTIAAMRGEAKSADTELAYRDVLGAWRYYLAHYNQGRGVVLIGHSQGASLLTRLIVNEIDGKPSQRLLVSAILAGGNIQVPPGADVGGSFRHIPLCRGADQTGCVIAYSTFLASHPPGLQAVFGKAETRGRAVACVNPALLLGHQDLDAELLATPRVKDLLGTVMVENPGMISAACTTANDRTFLAVSIKSSNLAAVALRRALDALSARAPAWGLHALDINLALGDLVAIVGREAHAWTAARQQE